MPDLSVYIFANVFAFFFVGRGRGLINSNPEKRLKAWVWVVWFVFKGRSP